MSADAPKSTLLDSKESFAIYWKRRLPADAADILIRCLFKALNAKTNERHKMFVGMILSAFTPITNPVKLKNGQFPWDAVCRAADAIAKSGWECNLPKHQRTTARGWLIDLATAPSKILDDPTCAYFWVRDLVPIQKLVQVAHVAAVKGPSIENVPFVIYNGGNEMEIAQRYIRADAYGIPARTFSDADIDEHVTAVCIGPVRRSLAKRRGIVRDTDTLLQLG